MLFNSHTFIFAFLPLCLAGFALAGRPGTRGSLVWLVLMSLVFYGWWEPRYLLLLGASVTINHLSARTLLRLRDGSARAARVLLACTIIANIVLLGWFKYLDFFISIVNEIVGSSIPPQHVELPLAISFFTLLQIAFLCDISDGKVVDSDPGNYLLFVTFFPHMIAGPIIHHSEMMPQFRALAGKRFDPGMLARGFFLFSIGLFKKVCVADTLARASDAGFANATSLDFAGSWITAFSYTLQIYFDFSGYSDMAIGLAMMFGIVFPINFDSPYLATSIRDHWRRWHMTLSRFLRDYVYVGLGGNRGGTLLTYRNLFLTFVIGGIWHGSGWPFLLWGAMHGAAMVTHRAWERIGRPLPAVLGWALTLVFLVFAFVMFRSPDLHSALSMYGAMLDPAGFDAEALLRWRIDPSGSPVLAVVNGVDRIGLGLGGWAFLLACLGLCLWPTNSNELARRFRPGLGSALVCVLLLLAGILSIETESRFIYFQF